VSTPAPPVLLSAPAMAQSYGGFGQTVQAAGQGLAQGVISHVDYQAGVITIQQAGNRIVLHGTPGQLGTLKAGEAVKGFLCQVLACAKTQNLNDPMAPQAEFASKVDLAWPGTQQKGCAVAA